MLKLIVVVALVALAIYLAVRFLDTRGRLEEGGSAARRRPVAPDDDPEFLRDLERKRRKRDGQDPGQP